MSPDLKQNTRKQILKTAGKLFSKGGYFGVSMQDIADQVGIKKASLYYHFKSKDELAEILLRDAINELKSELKESVDKSRILSDVFFNIIKTFLDFKIKHPEITLLHSLGLSSDNKIPIVQFVIELRIELIKFLRELIGSVDFARKLTYRTAFTLATTLMSVVLNPFLQKSRSSKQLASDFTALLFPSASPYAEKNNK